MGNWVIFDLVEIHGDENAKQISVQTIKGVPINLDHVFMVLPIMIPSELSGPGGQPIGRLASRLISNGGASATVDRKPDEVMLLCGVLKRNNQQNMIAFPGIKDEEN